MQARVAGDVLVRDEDGMALECVAIAVLLALVLPGLQKLVWYRIVMDRQQKIGAWFACDARSNREGLAGPAVISSTVLPNPASISLRSISFASRRLNSYSGTPRALIAPGTWAVWPTSTRTRNDARSHPVPLGGLLGEVLVSSPQAACQALCQISETTARARSFLRPINPDLSVDIMVPAAPLAHRSRCEII